MPFRGGDAVKGRVNGRNIVQSGKPLAKSQTGRRFRIVGPCRTVFRVTADVVGIATG